MPFNDPGASWGRPFLAASPRGDHPRNNFLGQKAQLSKTL
jgi:hypothetical protein